ncbi:Peptidase inhibitor I9 [Nocardioides alpinus]|uniref:Peptidase inhibitor I9 n=1 Tax=Nocardioides alpinus TaxID=748909 RepID=A0A1I0YQ49_9ACTN|nr:Peptidase inhibitor I9 [Nocardioides alpinus]
MLGPWDPRWFRPHLAGTSEATKGWGTVWSRPVGRILGCSLLALGLALPAAGAALADDAPASGSPATGPLTLVTLQGAGTSAGSKDAAELLARQDALLAAIGAGEPVYRWTTALNGFAAHLSEDQLSVLDDQPGIAAIEADQVRPLAGRTTMASVRGATTPRLRGGAGVVIGVVDSGIAPESPAFADVPGLGRDPRSFAGACAEGEGWSSADCTRKVVGARWFVEGFGADRVRSSESLSARDVLGHGTQVSSVAAGNAGISVRVDDRDAGRYGGVAPQARIAAYKACWGAPDPAGDGCSTADVVAAVDAAVADRVDVLSLALAGGEGIDTLQRALLGAAEADIVVVGASGNTSGSAYAAHAGPWVTTVGSAVGRMSRGLVALPGGRSWTGGGRPAAVAGRAVLAQDAPAPGVSRRAAGQCRRGALDSRRVAGRIVVCRRGGIGRIDKSEAVSQAGGRAMVLVNLRPGAVSADFHSVPTVHLSAAAGRELGRWVARHPGVRVRMSRASGTPGTRRTAPWSASGDPRGVALKPDAVADGDAVLGAVPETSGRSWGVFSGSSAATAHASGLAALLLAERDAPAAVVRSLLVTSGTPIRGSSVLAQGSGALPGVAPTGHLALDVPRHAWRRALRTHRLDALNTSSLLMSARQTTAVRTVTNVGPRPEYFSVTARGFTSHRVTVRPLAVRLRPGQSARFTITVSGPTGPGRLDDGELVWLGALGGTTRVPVALTR